MRRIVLVGFMGAGKTTVAGALALRMRSSMIDLDSFIIERSGSSPAEIIQQYGEDEFRDVESRTLRRVLDNIEAQVIALGGGTWTIEENRNLLAQHHCLSVWLDASFELCWKRIAGNGDSDRPLAPNQMAARELYERRRAAYELADLRIVIGEADADQIAGEILARISEND
ncbi:MAG: shikimate kinase [Blastocatellia bacterium]|jgi:shikimate kinase|nr:shikimate kinase [Blastocatellia bacterium]